MSEEPFRQAVLVAYFRDMRKYDDCYNEIYTCREEDAPLADDETYFLIHPDSDEVILECGAVVVLEKVPNFPLDRWYPYWENPDQDIPSQNVWRIIT